MGRWGQYKQDLQPAALRALERERDAYQLRLAGLSFRAIGDALGITGEGARQCVLRAVGKVRTELEEPPEEMRIMMVERTMSLICAVYPRAIQADIRAIGRVLTLDRFLADLLGLKSPAGSAEAAPRRRPSLEEVEKLNEELLELWREKEREAEQGEAG